MTHRLANLRPAFPPLGWLALGRSVLCRSVLGWSVLACPSPVHSAPAEQIFLMHLFSICSNLALFGYTHSARLEQLDLPVSSPLTDMDIESRFS